VYDAPTARNMLQDNVRGSALFEPYPGNRDVLYNILMGGWPCAGKSVAVIGTLCPWIEAALIWSGATSVTTVEYNVLNILPAVSEMYNWTSIHYDSFVESPAKFDVIATFSSIEHAGLGRYGDPVDPVADFAAMESIRSHLAPGGFVLWGAPVGRDALVWNAHRVYGPLRLPQLLRGFRAVAWYGSFTYTREDLCHNGFQPWLILVKTELLEDNEAETAAVHASIMSCPKL